MNPDLCELLNNNGTVTCYLSDFNGNLLSASEGVTCREDPAQERKNIDVTLPSGEAVSLQQVTLVKEGFVVAEITNDDGVCTSEPIPFSVLEQVLLCAPEGTNIRCRVTEFQCFTSINCQNGTFSSIDIFLEICQDIQVLFNATIDVPAQFCEPRQVIQPPGCPIPVLPPDCNTSPDVTTKQKAPLPRHQSGSDCPTPTENICISVPKVYDWIIGQGSFVLREDEVNFICRPCGLHLFVPAITICERIIQGKILCAGAPVAGVEVNLSAAPDVIEFVPNPTFTDGNGNFETEAIVDGGTLPESVLISAEATINGESVSDALFTIAECHEPCLIDIFTHDTITCNGILDGRVRCGERTIEGAVVELSVDSENVSFDPDPAITGENGNFFSGIIIAPGTDETVTITATTTVEGQIISDEILIDVSCPDDSCVLTLDNPGLITCDGILSGNISCGEEGIGGAEIFFADFPEIVTFSPNPAISDANGDFFTNVTVPPNTPLLSLHMNATTTVDGQTLTSHIGTLIECPVVECPCKFRLGIEGNSAPATVNVSQQGVPATFTGTINTTVVQCFTNSPNCNPAVNNFNISFGSGGTTINFIQGRRIVISCEGNNFARVHGTAQATGNVLNGVFEVLIEVSISPANIGTWNITANDNLGNAFSTTFSAPMNPIAFIGDCTDTF